MHPRFQKIFAMAPAPRPATPDSLTTIDLGPSLHRRGQKLPFLECSQWIMDQIENAALVSAGADVGHYVFIDTDDEKLKHAEPELFTDPPGVDRKGIQARAVEIALDFFR